MRFGICCLTNGPDRGLSSTPDDGAYYNPPCPRTRSTAPACIKEPYLAPTETALKDLPRMTGPAVCPRRGSLGGNAHICHHEGPAN